MPTHTHTLSWKSSLGPSLSKAVAVADTGETNVDPTVNSGVGNQAVAIALPLASLDAIFIVSNTNLTLKPNATGTNAVQRLTVAGAPAGGVFTLTGTNPLTGIATTQTVAYNAAVAGVQTAVDAMFSVGQPSGTNAVVAGVNGATQLGNVANPSTTPTVAVTGGGAGGGSLQAGAYYLKYTFVTINGETQVGPESAQFTVAAGNIPRVTLPALPAGAASISIYLTAAAGASGSETRYATGVVATTYDLAAAQSAGAAQPAANTAAVSMSITFGAGLAGEPMALMTTVSTGLTGGTSPAASVANTTTGVHPAGTISLLAGDPLAWRSNGYFAVPFPADITTFYASNMATGQQAVLSIRALKHV